MKTTRCHAVGGLEAHPINGHLHLPRHGTQGRLHLDVGRATSFQVFDMVMLGQKGGKNSEKT